MKRTLALILVLGLILSQTGGALAYIMVGDDPWGVNPVHQHSWQLENVDYTTCTGPAYYVYVCDCGESKVEQGAGPGHSYRETGSSSATCTEGGYREYTCSRCGESYRETTSALGHSWGGWQESTPGTCVTLAMRERTCSRCGAVDYQYWGYGDHEWGPWETVREPSGEQPGLRRRVCRYSSKHVEEEEFSGSGTPSKLPAPETDAPPRIYPSIILEVSYYGGPFAVGDSFDAELRLFNPGSLPLTLSSYHAELGSEETDAGQPLPAILEEDQEYTWVQTIIVTEADLAKDPSTLSRSWEAAYMDETGYVASDTAQLDAPLTGGQKTVQPAAALRLAVSQSSEQKEVYEEDDVVTFDVTLENNGGCALTGCQVQLDDQIKIDALDYGNLEIGESATCTFTVVINSAFVDAGRALLTWSGWGKDENQKYVYSNDEEIELPTGVSVPPDPDPQEIYALQLKEEWVNGPTLLNIDDSAEIRLTATNNSDETLYNVRINETWDSGDAFQTNGADLAPGEDYVVTANAFVTMNDWNYAKEHDGELYAHWQAVGYTANQAEVPSNTCDERFVIVHEEGEEKPELTLTLANGSGEGKQAGDWVECQITVQNTGDATVRYASMCAYFAGFAGEGFDMTDTASYENQDMDPNASFTATVKIRVTDDDLAAGAVIRSFNAEYLHAGQLYTSNTVQSNIPLSIIGTPPAKKTAEPELRLSAVCLDIDPFAFDTSGQTGDIAYQAVVSNIGLAECDVDSITVTTRTSCYSVSVGPYHLYPNDSTPNIPIIYDFSDADKGGDGLLHIAFVAHGSAENQKQYDSNEVSFEHKVNDAPPWIPPVETKVFVEKYEIGSPADPNGYALGEQVDYEIWVYNDSEVNIPAVSVYDPLYGTDAIAVITDLAPGNWRSAVFHHTVTQDDVDNQLITNTAYAVWNDPESGVECSEKSNTVIVYTLREGEPTAEIRITFVDGPDNGHYYEKDEVFPVRIDWKNTSKGSLHYVQVYSDGADRMGEAPENNQYLVFDGVLASGETGTFTYNYTVSDWEAYSAKAVTEFAYISALDENDSYVYVSAVESAPADGIPMDFITETPALKVEKVETSKPANGAYYTEGETITYNIFVTNTGDVDLTDVTVGDSLSDTFMGAFSTIEILHATETRKYSFSHVVTAEDVAAGKVVNYGLGYYTYDSMIDIPVVSDPVISPTAPDPGPVPPGTPGDDGHIKTPVVAEGKDDACIVKLVKRGDGTAEYEQHLCAKHAAIYQAAKASDTAAAWQQAASQWKSELEEMYKQILGAATGAARMTVMAERAAFYAYVDVFKSMIQAGDYRSAESAAAEKAAAEMLRQQCTELCYLIHYAPDARKDSLVTGAYESVSGAAASPKCAVYVTDVNGNTVRYDEWLCETHAAVDATMLNLADRARSRAAIENAFVQARRAWQAALNDQATAQYNAAEKDKRKLIASCRTLFDTLLEHREAFYTYFYPNNPETVAEIINRNVIMDVIRRCK